MLKKRFIKTMTFIVGSMLAFAIVACGDSGSKSPGGLSNLGTETYAGTANGVLYTLTITEKAGKAAYAPQGGDSYELTAAAKTSTGTVESFVGGTFTLAPSGDSGNTFFVTVSGIGITAMSGTITWDGGATESAPANFIPKTTGAADDPFLISTSADLLKVGKGTDGWTLDAHYKLTDDINMTGVPWEPIGDIDVSQFDDYDESVDLITFIGTLKYDSAFRGSFDGNGKKILNLKVDSTSDFVGLFGVVGPGGIVEGLGLENVDIKGYDSVGGIAGFNFGTIENCYVTGAVTGDVTGVEDGVGGIAGGNFGPIENCYVTGNVIGGDMVGGIVGENFVGVIKNCNTTGSVTGNDWAVGGIVGSNKGKIENCYATGAVTGGNESVGGIAGSNREGMSTIKNCYATGAVTGSTSVGGIVGGNDGKIENCVALNTTISASSYAGRVTGDDFGELSNNYARSSGMTLTGGTASSSLNGIHGEDIASWGPAWFASIGFTDSWWTDKPDRLPTGS